MAVEGKNVMCPVGKLNSVSWKVGVSTSSDNCKNLNTPFVVLNLKVDQPDGSTGQQAIEMNLPEFQGFINKLKEMESVLTTI